MVELYSFSFIDSLIHININNPMQNYIARSFFKFSTLTAQYAANKSKNAVRFETQNQLWDFQ